MGAAVSDTDENGLPNSGRGGEVGHRKVMLPVELLIREQQRAESTPISELRQKKAETNDEIDVGARLVCPMSIVHLGKDE